MAATTDLVHKHSLPARYCFSGWMLQHVPLFKTLALNDRKVNTIFAIPHTIGHESTREEDLPMSLVELFKKKFYSLRQSSIFVSPE